MNERSVAEIIGWEFSGGVWQKREGLTVKFGGPDVDDMLSWLAQHGDIGISANFGKKGAALIGFYPGGSYFNMIRTEAPTLHAALEAAVRSVSRNGAEG